MDELNSAAYTNQLLPSMAHQMAVPDAIKGAISDVVTNFYNSKMSSSKAVKALAKSVKDEM